MARVKKEAALTPEERLQAALVPDWEWPYKLPENWCWVYAPHIFDIEYGKGLPTKQLSDTGYPVFGANGQIGFYSEYMYKEPQALMSCRGAYSGTMNKSLPYSYVTSNSLIISSPRGLMGTDCIYYLFSALNVSELISGTAQPQVTVQAFDGFPIPLSPFAEQQRIVDRIESLFAKLDEAKEKAQAVVDSFETRKAAILHKAFTGELTAKWREEHNISKTTWGEKKWGDFLQSIEAGKNWSAEGRPPEGTEFGVVKVSAVTWGEFDELESKTCVVAEQWNSKTQIHKGDFLFSRANTLQLVGNCVIVRNISKRLMLSDKILRFKFDEIAHPRFVLYFTRSRIYREQVEQLASGNQDGMRNISQKNLKLVFFPIPTVVEQIEIISILDRAFAKEQQAKEAAEIVLDQIELMKKSILTRAFRGELGTNDPSEESAVELLKQVIEQEDGDVIRPKAKAKRIAIPAEIKPLLSGANEEAIVKLLLKAAPQSVSTQTVMSISKKKFELMDALRNLEKKQIVSKSDSGEYSLVR